MACAQCLALNGSTDAKVIQLLIRLLLETDQEEQATALLVHVSENTVSEKKKQSLICILCFFRVTLLHYFHYSYTKILIRSKLGLWGYSQEANLPSIGVVPVFSPKAPRCFDWCRLNTSEFFKRLTSFELLNFVIFIKVLKRLCVVGWKPRTTSSPNSS